MKKNKFVLTFIALVTFVGGAFAVANYSNLNSLYSYTPATGYKIIPTYAATATTWLSTTTLNATYYQFDGSTFNAKAPGSLIYVVTAQ